MKVGTYNQDQVDCGHQSTIDDVSAGLSFKALVTRFPPCLGCACDLHWKRKSTKSVTMQLEDNIQLLTAFKPRSTNRPFLLVYFFRTLVQDVEQNIGERIEDYDVDDTG
jgi:hypothetical protein